MKTFFTLEQKTWLRLTMILPAMILFLQLQAQQAVVPTPVGMGRNCNTGTGTTATSDSVKVFSYSQATNVLTQINTCKPKLAAPGFSPYSGSVAFNPQDQLLYYIETTTGNNSIVWRWAPNTCPGPGNLAAYKTYGAQFVVGVDFDIKTGNGYQLEFTGSSAPYTPYLRQVNFGTSTFGASQLINMPVGKNINVQSGDLVFTPTGKLYFAFDNKLFSLDYTQYGAGVLNAVFIDTLKLGAGNSLLGLSYAYDKLICSVQNGSNSNCFYKQIDISTGVAVLSNVTLASGTFTSTDMASIITGVGAAKKISSVTQTGTNTFTIQYDIKVRNFGNVNLTNVQVVDSVQKLFGAAFVSASIAPVGTLSSGITLNPLFNGNTNNNFFLAGSTMAASPPDSSTIRLTVNLNNPLNITYNNSAIATATGTLFANNVKDSSNNDMQLRPDLNGNDLPDDPGENTATPLNIAAWALLSNKIIDFNAVKAGSYNNVYFSVDNMEPGAKVLVQKSTDGSVYENVSELTAENSGHNDFSWKDQNPGELNLYRLQVQTPSGVNFYSNVVKISNKVESQVMDLDVLPNPFSTKLTCALNLKTAAKVQYRLLDFASRPMRTGTQLMQTGLNGLSIDNLENLPAGTYILEVLLGQERFHRMVMKK